MRYSMPRALILRSLVRGHLPLLAVLFSVLMFGPATAQTLDLTPYLNARNVGCIWDEGQRIFGGLDEGGLVIWDRADLTAPTMMYAGSQLSGNQVSDMAWTGRHLWLATRDGGLTRIKNPGGDMEFRQYSSNLGDIDLTAVTGTLIGDNEWVFYAMDGAGIGRIIDGLAGNLYTAEQDGLINNNVNALQFFSGQLFVATPTGISRFANNIFEDMNSGLTNLAVNDFTVTPDGQLLAAGNGGVFRWNSQDESWSHIGGTGTWAVEIASGNAGIFALGLTGSGNVLAGYDGSTWTDIPLPFSLAGGLSADTELLVGGRRQQPGMAGQIGHGWMGRFNGSDFDTYTLDASVVRNANGVTFGSDGTPWIGSHNADGISHLEAGNWSSIFEVASAENDSSGLINLSANILSMTTGTDGVVYAGQYTQGAVRHDPVAGRSDIMLPTNCGLAGGSIINMFTHPSGPVFFLHDWANAEKVEVLVDPDNWRNPDNWLYLPTGEGGLGTGPSVWDVVVQRNDVIWFAVEGTGLVRWDVNGDLLGPDDPLTWLDTSDDRWDDPISDFPGVANNPAEMVALDLAPDGSIWAGGNGLVRFSYAEFSPNTVTVHENFNEKTSPFAEGLVNGNVSDLAVDGNGRVWVATRSGINRGITDGGETTFEAWFDLGNYLSNSAYGALYSPDAITSLPGGQYRKIVVSPDGRSLLLSSDRGAVLLEPRQGSGGGTDEGNLSAAYLYPNPFHPGQGEGLLKLGGISADAVNGKPAVVQIFNVEGQLVYESDYVSTEVGFWDGRNIALDRNDVTSGMYVVKITYEGATSVQPLAVVR